MYTIIGRARNSAKAVPGYPEMVLENKRIRPSKLAMNLPSSLRRRSIHLLLHIRPPILSHRHDMTSIGLTHTS